MRWKMLNASEAAAVVERYLVTPSIVETDGILGNFDTLRAALEHLETFGVKGARLEIQTPEGPERFEGEDLVAMVEVFYDWPAEDGLRTAPTVA